MQQPIYFSRIEFRECAKKRENVIFLNLTERELSYQEFEIVAKMPAIQEGRLFQVGKRTHIVDRGETGQGHS